MATTLRGDDNFDSANPIPAGNFTAKAWVNFNGQGTVAIREDGNVSSLTDNNNGDYTVNYSVALLNSGAPLASGMNAKTNAVGAKTGSSITTASARVFSGFWDNSGFAASNAPYIQLHVISE